MNQYHIYEAIGRGKYSTVYKGRKKKSIEYSAIKSVDKSQKNKILQEVRILHSLDHSNVLKFYSWYETSAHLWLVLEYCVGGDLMSILRQDGKLPEDSILDIASDLVRALQYLHSKGIIYCDLKPSNILLDENGHIKLCDFELARKLNEISKTNSSVPQTKRGTPCYMAPELFKDDSVHSYASDLWALGCVLYECFVGRPPFMGREFTQLVKSILSDPTPILPGNPSRPFVNLINSLLVKDPAERIQWPELCGHAFWRTKITPVSLPSQPAFAKMIDQYSKPCLLERNGEKLVQDRTPPKYREKDVKGTSRQNENSAFGSSKNETLVKGTPGSQKTQSKVSSKVVEEKKLKETPSASKGVNLLRLSRIAKLNLQRENDKENYRRPIPSSSENDSEVEIKNTDMELDFNENAEDESHEEPEESDNLNCNPEDRSSNQNPQGKMEDAQNMGGDLPEYSSPVNINASDLSDKHDQESPLVCTEAVPMSPSASQLKNKKTKDGPGNALEPDSLKLSNNPIEFFWHPSDLSVKPVMPSRKADKISDVNTTLPFDGLQASDFVKTPKEQQDVLCSRIIATLSGNTSIGEKQNMIRYLEMLSNNADAANILTNGPVMLMLVKMLKQSKVLQLRVQLTSLIGLLIRHSTFIENDLANSGLLVSLTDGLRDKQEKVRRFSVAALGELLFYISTQEEHNSNVNPPESPLKDARSSPSGWQVSNSLISLVSSILRKGEDDMTQLYALRTIENICSQGASWASRFISQDVFSNLCYIYRASVKSENIRLTAGSCLVRLVRFNPSSIQSVTDKLSSKDMACALVKGNPREQQITLNLLNMIMFGGHTLTSIGRYLLPLMEEKNLVSSLASLIEQGSEIMKGKAIVFVAFLCKNVRRWLPHFFCNSRLLSSVDRLAKEKDIYVQQCLTGSVHIVASIVPSLLDMILGDIQQMMGGRRHGHISPLTSRVASKTNIHLFPVVLHLLGSLTFKRKIVSPQVLQQLSDLIRHIETPFQGRDDFQITLLRVIESITEEFSVILENPDIFVHKILPSLAVLYRGNKDGDARFLCLKILFDVMVIFLNEPSIDGQRLQDLKHIANLHFLPLYPALIEDDDPIPMYAQKLLVMLIECNYIKISDILHLKTISQCFEFLLGNLSNANVSSVKLCLALASAPEMESRILSQLKVVRRIGILLEFVYAKDMEDFLEPTLGLCRALLLRSVSCRKGFIYSKEPVLLGDGTPEPNVLVNQQECIRDISDFGNNVDVLLELSGSSEANIADIASECVVFLVMAAPREATTGLLTHLPKVSVILESWRRRGGCLLLVQRMLHALGYACRQYLAHAMILSLSLSEISRIEAILSEIKSSGTPSLTNDAVLAAMELQRLHRCI
ncbi:serine/threonine-protein kinase RUNKEL-like [Momordica charantia]|uniref:Serine/threonine-protein kinase RUNKEL-like n=1 Tax=Momordica charantia TaxID=3673 RepID=A0A6J1CSE7_MOMCH|nr:serine/threonine-protein kinase RUNKEL-like [Momordica charantia]